MPFNPEKKTLTVQIIKILTYFLKFEDLKEKKKERNCKLWYNILILSMIYVSLEVFEKYYFCCERYVKI